MHWIPLLVILAVVIIGPQLWVKYVLNHYNKRQEENFPGNGGEFARHLLNRYQLDEVKVEATEQGDHYDARSKAVRLSADKLEGRTLTAIATAAHEVGHAVQDFSDYAPFRLRERLASVTVVSQRFGSFLLFIAPILTIISKAPAVGVITALGAFAVMASNLLLQLATLPLELNASFRRALPLLISGNYITPEQVPAVRRILRACAYTYVAAAAANLLNFWYWLRILRR